MLLVTIFKFTPTARFLGLRGAKVYLQQSHHSHFFTKSLHCNLPHIWLSCTCLHVFTYFCVCECVLLSAPHWIPPSHNNNIPHDRLNHGHTTRRKPREVGGGQTWWGEGQRGERRERRQDFKALRILCLSHVVYILPEFCPVVIQTVFGLLAGTKKKF